MQTMALPFLRLPYPPHSHSKFFNPSTKSSLPSSFSFNHLNGGIQSTPLVFNPHFTSLTALTSSSPAAAAAEAEEKTEESQVDISDRRRLIAQNIPWTCTAEDIRALFEKHGTVLDVELSMYNKTRNRGLAFITMSSEEEATVALNNLNSYDLDGRIINIHYVRSQKKIPFADAKVPAQRYTVYVGNLAWRVRSEDLRELFSASGKVISAEIIYQIKPRRPAGYGFVSFASREEAEAAISTLNGKGFMGRQLRLGLGKLHTEAIEGTTVEVEESGEASNEVNMNGELAS